MPRPYIMTLMAANRVGILAALTTALDELGGNLREVTQTISQNHFAMLMTAEFPDDRPADVILDHIRSVCEPFEIEVHMKDPQATTDNGRAGLNGQSERYALTLTGPDRPGGLRKVVMKLARYGIDIAELQAGLAGEGRFVARFALTIPNSVDRGQLQRELDELVQEAGGTSILQHHRLVKATQSALPVVPSGD